MHRPPISKYFGWVQRFLFQVETGDLPFPQLSLDVTHDWPIRIRNAANASTTVAGVAQTTIYEPPAGKHGMLKLVQLIPQANIPATDLIHLTLELVPAAVPAVVLAQSTVAITAGQVCHLIGGTSQVAAGTVHGSRPQYVPFGFRVLLQQTSVAGGVTSDIRIHFIELDEFLPMPGGENYG